MKKFFVFTLKRYWLLIIFIGSSFTLSFSLNASNNWIAVLLGIGASAFTVLILDVLRDFRVYRILKDVPGKYSESKIDENSKIIKSAGEVNVTVRYNGGNHLIIDVSHDNEEKQWTGDIMIDWYNPTIGDVSFRYIKGFDHKFGLKKFIYPLNKQGKQQLFYLQPIENNIIEMGKYGEKDSIKEYDPVVCLKIENIEQ